jgi:hypothetical protein
MFKLVFYVPEDHAESVKAAVFSAGAGKIGNYDQCCWQVLGQGQFRPLVGSQPFIGDAPDRKGEARIEQVNEYRIEMVCSDEFIKPAVLALKAAHPYEEPAYDVCQLVAL